MGRKIVDENNDTLILENDKKTGLEPIRITIPNNEEEEEHEEEEQEEDDKEDNEDDDNAWANYCEWVELEYDPQEHLDWIFHTNELDAREMALEEARDKEFGRP
ncbi:hypothetical protein EON65_17370 [archaeon]|nr:MAG: hypothetical protein EON65_17370 [archaeon]